MLKMMMMIITTVKLRLEIKSEGFFASSGCSDVLG